LPCISPRSRSKSRAISSIERPRTSMLPNSVNSASDHSLLVSAAGGSSSTSAPCGSTDAFHPNPREHLAASPVVPACFRELRRRRSQPASRRDLASNELGDGRRPPGSSRSPGQSTHRAARHSDHPNARPA
jgi:hypothetical protein